MSLASLNIRIERIGAITKGVDGSDEYLLVTDLDGTLSLESLQEQLLQAYYKDANQPGGYFCYAVNVAAHPFYDSAYIAVVHHRYDV